MKPLFAGLVIVVAVASATERAEAGYRGSQWNLYEYCGSRPTFVTDPHGLWWWSKPKPCCNGTPYDPETQCCEDGKIAGKVPLWICKRPMDLPPGAVGVVDFTGIDDWADCGVYYWLDVAHSYICCDGPNLTCYGFQAGTEAGADIDVEMLATGVCEKRVVCPSVRDSKCNNPVADSDYSLYWNNCHNWAWDDISWW